MVLAHGVHGNIFNNNHVIVGIFENGVVDHFLRLIPHTEANLQALGVALAAEQHRLGGAHRRLLQTFSVRVLSNALCRDAICTGLTLRMVRNASAIIASFSSLLE